MEVTNLNDIAAFASVVKHGSYTTAAKQLGLTRSAVGKSVVRLEQRLQVRLLNRTTRSLSLTDDGRVLYETCVTILDELEGVERALAQRSGTPQGRLRISLPVALGRLHVMPVIVAFMNKWEAVTVEASLSDRVVDLIDERFDLAIRIGVPKDDSQLLTRTVAHQQMITCAAPEYLLRHGQPVSTNDLNAFRCLHFVSEGRVLPWNFGHAGKTFSLINEGALNLDNAEAIRVAALAGLGIAKLPSYIVAEDLRMGNLQPVLSEFSEPPEPIRVVYPSKRHMSPKVRCFIDELISHWHPAPWELSFV
ncbi:MAG: LysR family transcriptional regulator [Oxalobacteraceae bacterium]|nr:MAG: LysR family transcriptional regulator [Oxalobacteraceae bacterium]